MIRWKRAIRTSSSERFVVMRDRRAVATVDLHYLSDQSVSGLVVLDESAGWSEEQVPDLLAALNDDLLPSVEAARGTLSLMVVTGKVLGRPDSAGEGEHKGAGESRDRSGRIRKGRADS